MEAKIKSDVIRIRVTPEEKKEFFDFARYRGHNPSLVARFFLSRGMKNYQSKPLYPFVEEQS